MVQLENQKAHATEKAEATRASVVVALGGAIRLEPKKITTSHETRIVSIGLKLTVSTELPAATEAHLDPP